tara:strand:- start:534 stop:743 length:210 start_codon:yes stop_codon:yes gene_type:complete
MATSLTERDVAIAILDLKTKEYIMSIKAMEKTIIEKLSVLSKDELIFVNKYIDNIINYPENYPIRSCNV